MKKSARITETVQRSGQSFDGKDLQKLISKKKHESDQEIQAQRFRIVEELARGVVRAWERENPGRFLTVQIETEVPFLQWDFDMQIGVIEDDIDWCMFFVEVQGGIFSKGKDGQRGGAHNRGVRFTNNREKINAAQIAGHKVIEFTTLHFKEPYTYIRETLKAAMDARL